MREHALAVVAVAVIAAERVIQGPAGARRALGGLGAALCAEVEGVGVDAQESDQAV